MSDNRLYWDHKCANPVSDSSVSRDMSIVMIMIKIGTLSNGTAGERKKWNSPHA